MVNPNFGILPLGIPGSPTPFKINIPDAALRKHELLVRNAEIETPTFYNTHNFTDGPEYLFGANRDWLANAARVWVDEFDWRAKEKYWNTIPQFTMNVTAPSDGQVFSLHFAAMFSKKKDAIPIILSHGWPSSWLDFIPVYELLAKKYTPETLPYHIVTPSIPDYGFSTRDKLAEKELNVTTAGEALNELMKALGFNAYIAQGGDVGSALTAALGNWHDECKAVHFNNFLLTPSEIASVANLSVTPQEKTSLAISQLFYDSGTGYMLEQGTKPGTIALALGTNPVALLSWIGGALSESPDGLPLSFSLEQVSWYWFTKSYGQSLWAYRSLWAALLRDRSQGLPTALTITKKPLGYSYYPGEILSMASSWVKHWFPNNLVFFKAHEKGGHFPAFEATEAFLQDLEDFVAAVKTKVKFN